MPFRSLFLGMLGKMNIQEMKATLHGLLLAPGFDVDCPFSAGGLASITVSVESRAVCLGWLGL